MLEALGWVVGRSVVDSTVVVVCWAVREEPAERTLLLVERLQTIYSSMDEEEPCASRLFCQLGDVIADSDSPARVIRLELRQPCRRTSRDLHSAQHGIAVDFPPSSIRPDALHLPAG